MAKKRSISNEITVEGLTSEYDEPSGVVPSKEETKEEVSIEKAETSEEKETPKEKTTSNPKNLQHKEKISEDVAYGDFFEPNDALKDSVVKIPSKLNGSFVQLSAITGTSKQDIITNILEIWNTKMFQKEKSKMIKEYMKKI